MKDVPELRQVVTEGLAEAFCQAVDNGSHQQIQKFAMKACFSAIYDREEAFVKVAVKEMIARLRKAPGANASSPRFLEKLIYPWLQRRHNQVIFKTYFSAVHVEPVSSVVDLLERLNSQFPGDVGIFCTFFLNRILLKPGQAMFLGQSWV